MVPVLIQKATEADVSIIQNLAKQIWPEAYGKILSGKQIDYMLDLFYSEDSLRSQMTEGQSFYLLKTDRNIGFAAISKQSEQLWKLQKLYVLPSEQGKGLGKRLLEYVEKEAVQYGAHEMTLNVNRQNPALDFYKRSGYAIAEKKDIEIGKCYFMNDFIMQKSLT